MELTKNEIKVLKEIVSQGFFYDEQPDVKNRFLGYEVCKEDFNNELNPAGVISSLEKKEIIIVEEDDGLSCYFNRPKWKEMNDIYQIDKDNLVK